MKISKKLMLQNYVVFIILVCLCAALCFKEYASLQRASAAQSIVANLTSTGEIIHTLQLERGRSAGYLADHNATKALQAARQNSDYLITASFNKSLKQSLNQARAQCDKGDLNALHLYDEMIFKELNCIKTLSNKLGKKYISAADAIFLISLNKEYYGRLRAILNAVFSQNSMSIETYSKIRHLLSSIQERKEQLYSLQLPWLNKAIWRIDNSPSYKELQVILGPIISQHRLNDFQTNATDSFVVASDIMDQHKLILDSLYAEIFNTASKASANARACIILTIALSVCALIVYLCASLIILRSIRSNTAMILKSLKEFFSFINHKSEEPGFIELKSKDEFAQIAQQINEQLSIIKANYSQDQACLEEISQIANHIKDGKLNARITQLAANPNLAKLQLIINEILSDLSAKIGSDINTTVSLLNDLSDRSLSSQIPQDDLLKLEEQTQSLLSAQNMLSNSLATQSDNANIKELIQIIRSIAKDCTSLCANSQSLMLCAPSKQLLEQIGCAAASIKAHSIKLENINFAAEKISALVSPEAL